MYFIASSMPLNYYAVFWRSENKVGNGDFHLDETSLRAWLGRMRAEYPQMQHWGQSKEGNLYFERIPILIEEVRGGIKKNYTLQTIP